MTRPRAPSTIGEYIAAFPAAVQEKLEAVRHAVHEAAPAAEEAIKYGMPSFVWHGNLVHFGAFKNHLGFYPVPAEFAEELAAYAQGHGSVQFPYDQPLPLELIARIVRFRAKQNLDRTKARGERPG